jgi:RNA polymerase sigma-70 factor (ECF subfamily)
LARPDPLQSRDDTTLARLAAVGDRAALDVLLNRHVDRVHAICRRIIGDPQDALDASQEALIAVARSIHRFDGRAAFTTWLYRVATNAALDELRRRQRRPTPSETLPEPVAAPSSAGDSVTDRVDIDAALARIPEEFRAAVVLRDLVDLDYAQIAEVLDLPPGTVRSRIARGRAALALELAPAVDPTDANLGAAGNRTSASQHPTEHDL